MKWKNIFRKLLIPPIWLVTMLLPLATGFLIYAFVGKSVNLLVQYAAYAGSAYTLTILCTNVPIIYKKINHFRKNNRYIVRYQADVDLRVKTSLYSSVGLNLAYALMQLISGFLNHSVWFYALSGYYTVLALIRGLLLRDTHRRNAQEMEFQWKRYRFTGFLLVIMNLSLAVVTFCIISQNRGFSYHYIQTIAMAAYTFTITIMAVVNVIRYRKYNRPLLSAIKATNFAAALVSMLSLETAMLAAFGSPAEPQFRQIVTTITGACVCIIILVMAICMIRRGNAALRQLKQHMEDENGTEK